MNTDFRLWCKGLGQAIINEKELKKDNLLQTIENYTDSRKFNSPLDGRHFFKNGSNKIEFIVFNTGCSQAQAFACILKNDCSYKIWIESKKYEEGKAYNPIEVEKTTNLGKETYTFLGVEDMSRGFIETTKVVRYFAETYTSSCNNKKTRKMTKLKLEKRECIALSNFNNNEDEQE